MDSINEQEQQLILSRSQVEDLRLAASKMSGAERRNFQAAMTLKYCDGRGASHFLICVCRKT